MTWTRLFNRSPGAASSGGPQFAHQKLEGEAIGRLFSPSSPVTAPSASIVGVLILSPMRPRCYGLPRF